MNSNAVAGSSVIINDRRFCYVSYYITPNINDTSLAVAQLVLVRVCHDQPRGGSCLLLDGLYYNVFTDCSHALTFVMIQLVLKMVVATLTAFSNALFVTFSGSMMPISIMLPILPSFTSYP